MGICISADATKKLNDELKSLRSQNQRLKHKLNKITPNQHTV